MPLIFKWSISVVCCFEQCSVFLWIFKVIKETLLPSPTSLKSKNETQKLRCYWTQMPQETRSSLLQSYHWLAVATQWKDLVCPWITFCFEKTQLSPWVYSSRNKTLPQRKNQQILYPELQLKHPTETPSQSSFWQKHLFDFYFSKMADIHSTACNSLMPCSKKSYFVCNPCSTCLFCWKSALYMRYYCTPKYSSTVGFLPLWFYAGNVFPFWGLSSPKTVAQQRFSG